MWRQALGVAILLLVSLPVLVGGLGVAMDALRGRMPPISGDPTAIPTIVGGLAVLAGSTWAGVRLIRAGLQQRRRAPTPTRERATAGGAALAGAPLGTLQGFGLRYLDFHDRRDDGSAVVTVWLVAAFLPIAPVRRERIRLVGEETHHGIPLLFSRRQQQVEVLERDLPVAGRRGRVYAFYFGVFLPLLVGPVVAGLAYVVAQPSLPAGLFWGGALGCVGWGITVVALQERVMAR